MIICSCIAQQLHCRISKQSKKSVSGKIRWWYDIPISTGQKQTGVASVCTRFSWWRSILYWIQRASTSSGIAPLAQAKQLSGREVLESAKQIPQQHPQSPPKASSKRGKKPSWNNKRCAELPGYNCMTLPSNSVTIFSFLHPIKEPFILRKEKLAVHNLHVESKMTNVIFQNRQFFSYALENIFRLKRETFFPPCVYTFLSCNCSDVLTHLWIIITRGVTVNYRLPLPLESPSTNSNINTF